MTDKEEETTTTDTTPTVQQRPLTLDDLVITTTTTTTTAPEAATANATAATTATTLDIPEPSLETTHPLLENLLVAAPLKEHVIPRSSSIPITLTRSYRIHPPSSTTTSSSSNSSEEQQGEQQQEQQPEPPIPLDLLVQVFGDAMVVGISQTQGRIGNYLLVQVEPSPVQPTAYHYDVTHLLGPQRDDALLSVYAQRVAECLAATQTTRHSMTLIVGISLQPNSRGRDPHVFRTTVDLVVQSYRQAVEQATG